jgi:hypothetical protein
MSSISPLSPPTPAPTYVKPSAPNPIFSILWFFISTIIFFIVRFVTKDSTKLIVFVVYVFILILGEFFINMQLTSALCGVTQTGTALIVTFVPWLIIFGLLNVMLIIFKGWKQPFSNTFGYLATRIMGVNGLLDLILKSESDTSINKEVAKGLESIYTDKSLFINQIPFEGFEEFWTKMSTNYFKPSLDDSLKNKLRSMVFLKDLVSEFIWFSLAGCLVTSVAYNYITTSSCSKSAKDLKKNHEAHKSATLNDFNTKASNPKPRVYTVTE